MKDRKDYEEMMVSDNICGPWKKRIVLFKDKNFVVCVKDHLKKEFLNYSDNGDFTVVYKLCTPIPKTRDMTAKEIWKFCKENPGMLVRIKLKPVPECFTIIGYDLGDSKDCEHIVLLSDSSWHNICDLEYTLDFGTTFHEFKIEKTES